MSVWKFSDRDLIRKSRVNARRCVRSPQEPLDFQIHNRSLKDWKKQHWFKKKIYKNPWPPTWSHFLQHKETKSQACKKKRKKKHKYTENTIYIGFVVMAWKLLLWKVKTSLTLEKQRSLGYNTALIKKAIQHVFSKAPSSILSCPVRLLL